MDVLLMKDTPACRMAEALIKGYFPNIVTIVGKSGDPLPDEVHQYSGSMLISFLCPWVLPRIVLDRFRTKLNFHPAPPEYRGFGPYNFALYDDAKFYGVTCHGMIPELDAGPIYEVYRFPVLPEDTVLSLQNRSMATMLSMLYPILCTLFVSHNLVPLKTEHWSKVRHTRKELDELMVVPEKAGQFEIDRRLRALTYPGFEPVIVRSM